LLSEEVILKGISRGVFAWRSHLLGFSWTISVAFPFRKWCLFKHAS